MKTKISNYLSLMLCLFLSAMIIFSCGKDDNDPKKEDDNKNSKTSYVNFTITEADGSKEEFTFKDDADEFNSVGYFYSKADDPDLPGDQFQIAIYETWTKNAFVLAGVPEEKTHTAVDRGIANDYEVIIGIDIKRFYNSKNITYTVDELDISDSFVDKCKGSFSGTFSRDREEDATISGTFVYQ